MHVHGKEKPPLKRGGKSGAAPGKMRRGGRQVVDQRLHKRRGRRAKITAKNEDEAIPE